MVPLWVDSPKSIHGFEQSSRDYCALPPNLRDGLPYPLRLVSHGECTSVYDYTLDMTNGESWRKAIGCHDSLKYYNT